MTQPTWGQQPQQPGQPPMYGQPQPGPYGPPPPQKKGIGVGGGIALGCGGLLVLGLIFVIIGLFASSGDSGDNKAGRTPAPTGTVEAPAAQPSAKAPAKKEEPASDSPVKVVAKKTEFEPSVLHDGSKYTSVKVTITNNGKKKIDINPLYLTITDTNGSKHTAELGVDENQIDTVDLLPGENITGVITGKGAFTPAYVTYTPGLFGEPVRGNVS